MGVVINASRNYAGKRNDRICVAAPIRIGDDIYYAGVIINRNADEDMQNYYLHDVITIEKNSLSLKDTEAQYESARMDETVSPYTIFQQLNNINNLSENDVISDEGRFSLPDTDSEGNSLTDAQKEYFKGSKIVNGEGKLMPVYHGTSNDFTEFDYFMRGNSTHGIASDLGFFFSNEYDHAEYWSNEAAGNSNMEGTPRVMKVYLDIKNPYEFDFDLLKDQRDDNGNTWEEDVEEAAYMDEYDGVIARNAENDDSGKKRTIIFTFEQGQIKVSSYQYGFNRKYSKILLSCVIIIKSPFIKG